jgi:hypothetical protein
MGISVVEMICSLWNSPFFTLHSRQHNMRETMQSRRVLPSAIITFFILVCHPVVAADNRDLFLSEYTPSSVYLSELKRGFAIDAMITSTNIQRDTTTETAKCVLNDRGFYICDIERERKQKDGSTTKSLGYAEIGNSRYWAFLENKPEKQFVLKQLIEYKDPRPAEKHLTTGGVYELQTDRTFRELVADPSTEVLIYKDTTWQGQAVKLLRLRFPYQLNPTLRIVFLNDYFFLPAQHWLCVGVRSRSQSKPSENIYQETIHHFDPIMQFGLIPKTIEQYDVDENKQQRTLTKTITVSSVVQRDVSEAEISLSEFGILEPGGSPTPSGKSNIQSWLLAVFGGSAALAIFFSYLRSRSNRQR